MSFPADVAEDFAYFDNNETVTLIPNGVALSGGFTGITASISAIDKKTARSAGAAAIVEVRTDDMWFDLFVATMPVGAVVNESDRVKRENGSIWFVMSSSLRTFASRWHCLCRKHPGT